jgi:hypothetical protein
MLSAMSVGNGTTPAVNACVTIGKPIVPIGTMMFPIWTALSNPKGIGDVRFPA